MESAVWRTGFVSPYKFKLEELRLKQQKVIAAAEENRPEENGCDNEMYDDLPGTVNRDTEGYESDDDEYERVDIAKEIYNGMVRAQYSSLLKTDKWDKFTDDDKCYDTDPDPAYKEVAERNVNKSLLESLFDATEGKNTLYDNDKISYYFNQAPEHFLWKIAAATSDKKLIRILDELHSTFPSQQQPDGDRRLLDEINSDRMRRGLPTSFNEGAAAIQDDPEEGVIPVEDVEPADPSADVEEVAPVEDAPNEENASSAAVEENASAVVDSFNSDVRDATSSETKQEQEPTSVEFEGTTEEVLDDVDPEQTMAGNDVEEENKEDDPVVVPPSIDETSAAALALDQQDEPVVINPEAPSTEAKLRRSSRIRRQTKSIESENDVVDARSNAGEHSPPKSATGDANNFVKNDGSARSVETTTSLRSQRRSTRGSTKKMKAWNRITESLCDIVMNSCNEFKNENPLQDKEVSAEVTRSRVNVTVETENATLRFQIRVYSNNGVWDMKRFKRDMRRNWRSLTKAQQFAVCFIFTIKNRSVDGSFPERTELHHMVLKCLDGSDDSQNTVLLEVIDHIKIHICFALIFDDIQVYRAAAFMLHRGRGEIGEDEFYQYLRDDKVLMNHSKIREMYSDELVEVHKKRKNNETLTDQEEKIMQDYKKMQDGYRKYRQEIYDISKMIQLGHTKPADERQYHLMMQVVCFTKNFLHKCVPRAEIRNDKQWIEKYNELEIFYQKNGHTIVRAWHKDLPPDEDLHCNDKLFTWVKTQKARSKMTQQKYEEDKAEGKRPFKPLSAEERVMLDELKFCYDVKMHDFRKWAVPLEEHIKQLKMAGKNLEGYKISQQGLSYLKGNLLSLQVLPFAQPFSNFIGRRKLKDLTGYYRHIYVNYAKYVDTDPGSRKSPPPGKPCGSINPKKRLKKYD